MVAHKKYRLKELKGLIQMLPKLRYTSLSEMQSDDYEW